jgi:purine-binding chemotaxis protein CheW
MDKMAEVPGGGSIATPLAVAGKYLTFMLDKETYGLGILKVQEIIGMMPLTRMPKTPEFVRGIINLRGKVIPVIGLRVKFGMESREDTDRTCIVVVQVSGPQGTLTMGLLVDEVSEVLNVTQEQIEEPPTFGTAVDTHFILGMGKIGQKVVMLLDADKVLSGEELELATQAKPAGKGA